MIGSRDLLAQDAAPLVQETPSALAEAVERARDCLLAKQQPDGHWVGELQGDTILETEYILLMAFLGKEADPRVGKAARYVLQQQMPEGGWCIYPGGPFEMSASVKAYLALKIAGHDPQADYMRRAAHVIRANGGAIRCNSFTKFYLAALGQFPYCNCPSVPPEMMFLPRWAYFNIHAMSAWTRTIVIPLSIFSAHQPVRRLPEHLGIRELFLDDPFQPAWSHPPTDQWFTWHNFFLGLDQVIKLFETGIKGEPGASATGATSRGLLVSCLLLLVSCFSLPLTWLRKKAIRRAADWMIGHFEDSDGVGAIFPPMIYTAIGLRCLGYADESPEMTYAMKQIEDLMIEEDGAIRLQPCVSPVWDTALALNALGDLEMSAETPAVARAVSWLLAREVRRPGDWSVMNPGLEPGGWFFEYRNGFYPDTDDTAMALMALAKATYHSPPTTAVQRGLNWLLAMQNSDGGWAAFDRDINREVLTKVPFADHNAMLDPSCPDITARVLESLGYHGFHCGHPRVRRALAFIERTQEPEGCWIGRWGVNYIYGTWQVLQGLRQIGYDMDAPMVRKAVAWLKSVQQPGGGWGESCRTYDEPWLKGQGTPTASQTGWALLGLLAAGEADSPEVAAGIDYLLRTQQPDGNWHEDPFTGTGFPKVFYLKYHLYSLYFPVMALARYQRSI